MARIQPTVWTPPPPTPRTGAWAATGSLDDPAVFAVPGRGPEDVLVDDDGTVLTGLADGRVVRVDPERRTATTVADTGGRPLGLEWLPDRDVLVCDAERGLLRVAPASGAVEALPCHGRGPDVALANNAAVAADGTILFTDSTQRFSLDEYMLDVLEHGNTGRLLRRDVDGTVDELLVGLNFANGVALVDDDTAVLVAATCDYAVHRVELAGERAGTTTTLHRALPGFPDNMATDDTGLVWLAVPAPRDPLLDRLLPRAPALRRGLARMPDALRPGPRRSAMVVAMRPDGTVVHNLQGDGRAYRFVTGVRAAGDWLWLGSQADHATAIARVPRPA